MSCSNKVKSIPTKLFHLHFSGIRKYRQGDLIQQYIISKHLHSKLSKNTIPKPVPLVLSFEFSPVYTGGRREKSRPHDYLTQLGAEFIQTSRGGEITYHGPGQLVAYPILDLLEFKLKSKCYIDLLQKTIKDTLTPMGIKTVDSSNTGVWVDEKTKISSIGVNIQRSITSHGISLNLDPDLKFFNDPRLVICGLPDARQTSVKQEIGLTPSVQQVGEDFVHRLGARLGVTDKIVERYVIDQDFDEDNVTDLDKYMYI